MARRIKHIAGTVGLLLGVDLGCGSHEVRDFATSAGSAGLAGEGGLGEGVAGKGHAGSTVGSGGAGETSGEAGTAGDAGADGDDCDPGANQACWESVTGVPISSPAPEKVLGNCRLGERVCGAARAWGPCKGALGPEATDACSIAGDDANCNGRPNDECACASGTTRPCGVSMGGCKQGTQTCTNSEWSECVGEVKAKTFDSCNDASDDSNCNGVHDGCPCNGNERRDCGDCGTQTCAPAIRDWGACKPSKPPVACADCGMKTCGSTGSYGACVGVTAATCSTATTLTTCKADGSATAESCFACTNNTCKADPCAGKACSAPPANICASATQLTAYDTTGSCSNQNGVGVCTYTSHASSCNCQNNACTTDPCIGVICNSPPGASCNGNTLTKYAVTGTCSGAAKCNYTPTDSTCAFGCANGACKPDPCSGVTCSTPPATSCSGTTQTSYASGGTCSSAAGTAKCGYTATNVQCASNKQCGANAACVTCKTDSNCGASCTACSGESPKCLDLGTTSACVGCIANEDCSAPGTACQASSNACLKKNGQTCTAAGQCVSNACSTFYADVDGDGFGNPDSTVRVCGVTPPAGYLTDSKDCCDADPAAFPGQLQYFQAARMGCGGFDYNCDGTTTKLLTQQAAYTCNVTMNFCDFQAEGWSAGVPECGMLNNWLTGCSYSVNPFTGKPGCSTSVKFTPSQPVQTCR